MINYLLIFINFIINCLMRFMLYLEDIAFIECGILIIFVNIGLLNLAIGEQKSRFLLIQNLTFSV